ncbi:MAG: GNAT family N-acetyltransferase [Methanosarcina sp.]|jgi:predicted N-acetyltransferase YhbS
MPLKIRPEPPSGYPAISEVNDLAFGQPAEGKLVENLRKNPRFVPELLLVAEADGKNSWSYPLFPDKDQICGRKGKGNNLSCSSGS